MSHDAITSHLKENRCYDPPAEFAARARIRSFSEYERLYRESLEDPAAFWGRESRDLVFRTRWSTTVEWNLPNARWFLGATLNVTESCLDRHLATPTRNKAAILWEGELGQTRTLTYAQLYRQTVLFADVLRRYGVGKGDRVVIYMGMVPEVVVAMLACARLGAVHTVIFGGFAADAIRDRIHDSQARLVITQDGGHRRGEVLGLKDTVDRALDQREAASVEKVIVYQHLGHEQCRIHMREGRDVWWHEVVGESLGESKAATIVDGEHPLFILYTSGSTGKPKGILHTTAGYLVGAHVTSKYVFDLRDDDVYWCTADVGWVTGHSYLVYGPLSNGATCLMYEGAVSFPDWGRLFRIIERHGVTILYTAPTAIRTFMRHGDDWPRKADLSSLRLLGSVGEPINPEAWIWYHTHVGGGRCPVVDTWWQTETGSIMLSTLPGAASSKPGSTGLPLFGVSADVVQKDGATSRPNAGGMLVLKRPWPSMLRGVWGDDDRFRKTYFSEVPGMYFTGDGARRDEDGYFWVIGRIDDVLNVAGHRLGTAEVESALASHPAVAEAAAVGRPDDLKGQALVVFVSLRPGATADGELAEELIDHVGNEIGRFARPTSIRFTDALPKTRSGKIMRRLLKDVAMGRQASGDTSTLEDLSVLAKLLADED
jgi:acetyl-CoA synthetase